MKKLMEKQMKITPYVMLVSYVATSIVTSVSAAGMPAEMDGYPSTVNEQCQFNPEWITSPSLATEVAKSGKDDAGKPESTFCDFYQFSLQSFIYLMSTDPKTNEPYFYSLSDYPMYRYDDTNDSCLETSPSLKNIGMLSASINQAADNATIYDQQNNVVYYSVQFSQPLCQAQPVGNLPAETLELKMAWKVLQPNDPIDQYIHIKKKLNVTVATTPVSSSPTEELTLGLMGLHLVQSTPAHPEMIWTTFEHVESVPDCYPNPKRLDIDYAFAKKECVVKMFEADFDSPNCAFNHAPFQPEQHGKSSAICRVYPQGSDVTNVLYYQNSQGEHYPSPSKYQQNISAIKQLNRHIETQAWGRLSALQYFIIGGSIWQNDINVDSDVEDNLRGSLENANTLLETTVQGPLPVTNKQTVNCFGCHYYAPNQTATIITSGDYPRKLSHIFSSLHKTSANGENLITPHDFSQ
ncbi:hypothetical protein [Shewanella sp. YLB-07]|uniref:hypothetical protein n=1 Tax=Shewanella sp. YLB-07 TaxID=2601268 RepID=UPI00128E107D|nr:hypothetical protein [Shewanella sp. YLB-07]MPY24567.1 hypothetical protein [Shewanella sp. YLB-07]